MGKLIGLHSFNPQNWPDQLSHPDPGLCSSGYLGAVLVVFILLFGILIDYIANFSIQLLRLCHLFVF